MLGALLVVLGILLPLVLFVWNQMKASTPSLRWPKLAPMVKLEYEKDPPRMTGQINGKDVSVSLEGAVAVVEARLARRSLLRVEVGPKDEVQKRAGMVVPDAVSTGDAAFEERFAVRCSDKNEGQVIFDAAFRQRVMALPHVDILGQGDSVRWTVPDANDPDKLEQMLDIVSAIAIEMERYPA